MEQETSLEKAILVGCQTQTLDDSRFHYSMKSLLP